MTAIYMDGFDHYGVSPRSAIGTGALNQPVLNMLDGSWAEVTHSDTLAGGAPGFIVSVPPWGAARTGAGCLSLTPAVNPQIARKVLPSAQAKTILSFGFALDTLPSGNFGQIVVDFRNNSNTVLYSLGLSASGQLILYNGPQTSVNAVTSGPVIRAQTWHFIEMELDLTGGTCVVRVDDATGTGTPVINATVATSGTTAQIAFGQYNASVGSTLTMYWDDLFLRNASGSVNNGFLGDRRVATLFTNSDTAIAGWTPSYYQEFGAGIATFGFVLPNQATPFNLNAYIGAAAATSLDIGAGDFTLETFVRFDALPAASAYSTIFSRWDSANNRRSYRLILGGSSFNNGCLQFDTSTDGSVGTVSTPIVYPWVPNTNQWYHLALVRSAGELLLFVDGAQFGLPITDSSTYFGAGPELFALGAEVQGTGTGTAVSNSNVIGRYDETRFTNGFARYTGPFSPPVAAFPRGSGSDPHWADVVLLCGYDSGITDESGFARTLSAQNGAVSFLPNDGAAIGVYSTVNKATPDDNTFISAALVPATNVLTMTSQPTNGTTVTVGTTDGSTPAVYTFKTSITSSFGDVLIDTTAQNTLINLFNAINAGSGSGTKYGSGTTANFDVSANQLPVGQIEVVASTAGTAGNSIASTSTSTAAWATTTLTGGANIPGPSAFKFQRPPSNTTIISALQTTVRAYKTDSGLGSIQTALIGPLGGTATGSVHPLAIGVDYYNDIIETDPDTSGPLSPTTIINGKFQIDRTA